MTHIRDTHPPTTPDPAPGLRVQQADALFTAIPEMATDVATAARPGEHCLDFTRRLRLGPTPEEAITLMAFALQPRHAVWWGHECLKAAPEFLTAQDTDMLALAAAWVAEPDEPHRYGAMDTGMRATPRGPGAWLAIAAGWSGGSMSRPDLPEVPVPLFAIGRALNAGVLSALARAPQVKRRRMLEIYVSMAEVLAKSA
jgi:hypothetical protein